MILQLPMLEVIRVSKAFGGIQAINELNLLVNEKEIVGLIGPNGSGKTTLLNLIAGALKLDRGEIRFRGKEMTGTSREQRCVDGICRTFQLSRPFLLMTVLQNVMLARYYGRNPAQSRSEATSEAEELLEFTGLKEKAMLVGHSLSLSERKKLELARALAGHPYLLLLDEFMAGLNPAEIQKAMEVIRGIKGRGITVIMVEHIIRAVMGLSDRVIVLNVGQKIAEGSPKM